MASCHDVGIEVNITNRRPRMASITQALQQIKADLQSVLSEEHIAQVCQECGHTWRTRLLDPIVTVHIFILQVLHGNTAMTHLPRLVGRRFTAAAYCLARQRLPLALLQGLVRRVVAQLQRTNDAEQRWRGHRTFFVDGSSCSMPDTPDLRKHFGQPSGQEPGCGFPIAHLLALCDAATGTIIDLLASSWRIHDLTRMAELHPHLQGGDVLVADRGFCSYAHLALLFMQKVQTVFRVHQRIIVDFRPHRPHAEGHHTRGCPRSRWLASLGFEDQLVMWRRPTIKARWMTAEAHAELPEYIVVRELRYRVGQRGFRTRAVTLVTTLLDPEEYPGEALAELYGARWQIEVNFRHLKQTLGLDVLKSQTAAGVRKELLVFALVYNLVCQVMTEAAAARGLLVARVSFIDALRALVFASHGQGVTVVLVNPHRPGRTEPRVRKRRPKEYPLMTKPRPALRQALLEQDVAA
jgi:hypothetical protein